MKYLLFYIFCFSISFSSFAQLDSQNNSTAIPAADDKDSNSTSLDIKPSETKGLNSIESDKVNGLSVPKTDNNLAVKEDDFSMFGEKFANPAQIYQKQLKRNLKMSDEAETKQFGNTSNQFLGDFSTKAKYIKVIYRDHEYFDGDRIRVFVNEDVYQSNILLESDYKGFKLDLNEGFNKIDFQALNQGTSGPNTAEFQVMDDTGNIISSNRWNLATGVKASIMIIKE